MDEEATMVPGVRNAPEASEDAYSSPVCGVLEKAGASDAGGGSAKKTKKSRRPRAGRIAYSKDRNATLAALYRFGGLTARQLAAWFEIVDPALRGVGSARMPKSLRTAYRTLESLQRSKLILRVAVVRDHLGAGRPEDLCYLSPASGAQAIKMAAAQCGVRNPRKARAAYGRHNLPGHPEHVAFRTDVMLRVARDAVAGDVGFDPAGAWGESYPGFPYWVLRPAKDKAGEPLPRRKNARPGYDPNTPDLRLALRFGDDLELRFDVEVEREVRTGALASSERNARAGVIPKLEARADHHLRLLARRETEEVEGWKAERERLRSLILEARERIGVGSTLSPEAAEALRRRVEAGEARMKQLDERILKGSVSYLVSPPEGIVPVVIVMRTKKNARGMRDRIRRALEEGRMPRVAELRRRTERHGFEAGRLVLFAGWDSLQPATRENLPTSDAEPEDHASALGEEYLPLYSPCGKGRASDADRVEPGADDISLRDVALERAGMSDVEETTE
ncbi:MAG: hypothetical protein M3P49_00665 [Actinomycetota bacterium]|nr:hypothetical protein [Actinomycetota bacterium]